MQEQITDLPFPFGGLNVSTGYSKQPPGTTPSALNCRGYESRFGRDRGGQRPGLTRYCPVQLNSTHPIQCITFCETTFVLPSVGTNAAASDLAAQSGGKPLFGKQASTAQFGTANNGLAFGAAWDQANHVYVAQYESATAGCYVYSFTDTSGSLSAQRWKSAALGQYHTANTVAMTFGGGFLWAATGNTGNTAVYLYQILPSNGTIVGGTALYTAAKSTPSQNPVCNYVSYAAGLVCIGYNDGSVDLYNSSYTGNPLFLQGTAINVPIQSAQPILDIDTDGSNFYVLSGVPATAVWLTKVFPNGGIGYSNALANVNATSLCYDAFNGQLAIAYTGGTYGAATYNAFDGTLKVSYAGVSAAQGCIRVNGTGGYVVAAYSNSAGSERIVFTWYSGTFTGAVAQTYTSATAFAAGFPKQFAVNGSPATIPLSGATSVNTIRGLGISNGTLKRFDTTGVTAVGGVPTTFSASAPTIFAAQVNQQVIFLDGASYLLYDAFSDSVKPLVPTAGLLPTDNNGNPGRLCCQWRNRLMVSGLPYDPNNYFGSALGDATNWNYNPSPSLETQAFAGNNVTAGQVPDQVQCLIPYNDEILLFGALHTIYQMTGDPLSGGRIDLVTDQIGMAWGAPWCRDGQGNIYFVSSDGAVYQFAPGGVPVRLSDPIAELLFNITAGTNLIRMAWSEPQAGFHVFITPAAATTVTKHYFYCVRTHSWWQDQLASVQFDPLAVCVFEGPLPYNRLVLIGGKDGFIRAVDPNALDDDGTAINSFVVFGPIQDAEGNALTLSDIRFVLETQSAPVGLSVYAGADALAAINTFIGLNPIYIATLTAGRNRSPAVRVTGQAMYVAINSNGLPNNAWQMEWMKIKLLTPSGRARQRMF